MGGGGRKTREVRFVLDLKLASLFHASLLPLLVPLSARVNNSHVRRISRSREAKRIYTIFFIEHHRRVSVKHATLPPLPPSLSLGIISRREMCQKTRGEMLRTGEDENEHQ